MRTINCQTSEVQLLNSIDAYRQSLLISVGIDGYDNSTTNTCIVTTNNGTICSPSDLSQSKKLFQFGAHLEYLQKANADGSKWIVDNTEKIVMYSASLKQDLYVLRSVKADMQVSLKRKEKFFSTFGN